VTAKASLGRRLRSFPLRRNRQGRKSPANPADAPPSLLERPPATPNCAGASRRCSGIDAAGFLEQAVAPQSCRCLLTSAAVTERAGDTIGRYRLLQQIGEGGCGVVYMAEQAEPVRRRVAVKIINLGMDTKSVIARFEAERQALAMMDHPNIAKVLDAGATATGRPYFVMELVRGMKITEFCDEKKLSTRERLDLFVQVCRAIQHAHQKGIIHRDIKPSNILVTMTDGSPVPKVIDFGIAKATGGQLAGIGSRQRCVSNFTCDWILARSCLGGLQRREGFGVPYPSRQGGQMLARFQRLLGGGRQSDPRMRANIASGEPLSAIMEEGLTVLGSLRGIGLGGS
jgi:hypothetical protein